MNTLIIDGDPIAWTAAHYAANNHDAGNDAVRTVRKLMATLTAERAIVCLSDPSRRYWRHGIWPTYKASRHEAPELLAGARAGLASALITRTLEGLEADDVAGILATSGSIKGSTIIVGNDKDFLTIPGDHYRPKSLARFHVTPQQAACCHLQQTLAGDSGEFPGCPGIGDVTAAKIVTLDGYTASPADAWQAVVATFVARGFTAEDALLQARVARICHASDFDLTTRQVRLWMPPSASTPIDSSLFEQEPAAGWPK